MSKYGELVYMPKIKRYGFVNEILSSGIIKSVKVFNHDSLQFDIIEVIHDIVEAVGMIKGLIVAIKFFFKKSKL